MAEYRWGVLGTGYIAGNFSESMEYVPGGRKAAVTGINMEEAEAFAKKHGYDSAYDDFDNMLAQAKPDIVYIAVPNNLHFQYVMKALDAGCHVLCEKPAADNAKQLQKMIDKAAEKNCFLMEGVWTRCFPAVRKVAEWLQNGEIGAVQSVHAGFGIKALEEGWQPWKRSAASSAGAIRDVGIYVLSYAFLAFGIPPETIFSNYKLEGGTDMHEEMMLGYPGGYTAFLTSSFLMTTEHHVMIYGEKGAIRVGEKLWCPNNAELFQYSDTDVFALESRETFDGSYESHGFQFEISHVQECIGNGKIESSYYPLGETVEICKVIDELRGEWGVKYPADDE